MVAPNDVIIDLTDLYLNAPTEAIAICEEFDLISELHELVEFPIHMALCRADVNAFLEYILFNPDGDPVVQADFHIEWQESITQNSNVLIAAPRGHGKTTQVAGRIVWELGRNHNLRIKLVGSTDEKAQEILAAVRDLITKSDRVLHVFPDLEIDFERGDKLSAFFVKRTMIDRNPSLQASGVMSAGAGGRADILICDDVVDYNNSVAKPEMRAKVLASVREVWFSQVSNKGRIVWICTPYHVLDASHEFKRNEENNWAIWWTPAITLVESYDEQGNVLLDQDGNQIFEKKVLWPAVWDYDRLMKRQGVIGTQSFARQYLLKVMADEDRTFPDACLEQSWDLTRGYIGQNIPHHWATYGGVDLASTLGKKSAYTVVFTLAKDPDSGKLYPKSLVRRKMGFNDTMKVIEEEYHKHGWRMCFVESNQYQIAVTQALSDKDKNMPVKGFQTHAFNKHHEAIGLPGLNVAIEKGAFGIPAAKMPLSADDTSPLGIWYNELANHPGAGFSDTIMAFWFAWRAALEGAGNFDDLFYGALEDEEL